MEDFSKGSKNTDTQVRLTKTIQGLPGLGKGSFAGEESQGEEDLESRLNLNFNLQALGSH